MVVTADHQPPGMEARRLGVVVDTLLRLHRTDGRPLTTVRGEKECGYHRGVDP